jgi:hypothetical protein
MAGKTRPDIDEPWIPFHCNGYDSARGGYAVQRRSDGCPCAWFVCESEALWFVDQANKKARGVGHSGFADFWYEHEYKR